MIFVFGSNLGGYHGAGAALHALENEGAILLQGIGHHGNSYGIPTKGWHIETLPLEDIAPWVVNFIEYAFAHPELEFNVTRIGCGLAGYKDKDIAPLFEGAPDNCQLPEGWREIIAEIANAAPQLPEGGPTTKSKGARPRIPSRKRR